MSSASISIRLALVALLAAGSAACAGGGGTVPRAAVSGSASYTDAHSYTADHATLVALGRSRQQSGWFESPVPPDKSFSMESGIEIKDADIERFIDPEVTGEDRKIAKSLMAEMPRDKRGDFIYVGATGRIVANHIAIKRAYLASPRSFAGTAETNRLPPRQIQSGRHMLSQQYPPIADGNQGGPLLREFSQLGETSAFGFVTVPCNDINLYATSRGDLYFGENGTNTGQTEGGLEVRQDSSYSGNESISLYARSTALQTIGQYAQVQFPTHYSCGQPIELVYGHLPGPNYGKFFASASLPQYTPSYYSIPGGTVISTNVSYVFTDLPQDFSQGGYDPYSQIATPCVNCYVRRMTTIAQRVVNGYSGECFGYCHSLLGIRWEQVHMGQTTYYDNTPQLITIHMKVVPTAWYGGYEEWPDSNRVARNPAGGNGINSEYEGIYAQPQFGPSSSPSASGTFGLLHDLPGPCTGDAYGDCGWYSTVNTSICDHGDGSSPGYVSDWQYQGYSSATGQTTTFYGSNQLINGCQTTASWQPTDPQTYYHDTNLPGPYDAPPMPPVTGGP